MTLIPKEDYKYSSFVYFYFGWDAEGLYTYPTINSVTLILIPVLSRDLVIFTNPGLSLERAARNNRARD